MLIEINPVNPQPRKIRQAVEVLREGGVIAYPTDTVYGIGCDIMCKRAIQRVYRLKHQTPEQPFSFICADLTDISTYAKVTNYQYKMMRRLLPGPYTFILEGSRLVPKIMLNRRKEAGIRVPDHPVCLALVLGLGNPVITTSAKAQGGGDFSDASLLHDHYKNQIDLVLDGGPVAGKPSSVVSLIGDEPEILREGQGDVSMFT